jgi:hypothetical protein
LPGLLDAHTPLGQPVGGKARPGVWSNDRAQCERRFL